MPARHVPSTEEFRRTPVWNDTSVWPGKTSQPTSLMRISGAWLWWTGRAGDLCGRETGTARRCTGRRRGNSWGLSIPTGARRGLTLPPRRSSRVRRGSSWRKHWNWLRGSGPTGCGDITASPTVTIPTRKITQTSQASVRPERWRGMTSFCGCGTCPPHCIPTSTSNFRSEAWTKKSSCTPTTASRRLSEPELCWALRPHWCSRTAASYTHTRWSSSPRQGAGGRRRRRDRMALSQMGSVMWVFWFHSAEAPGLHHRRECGARGCRHRALGRP